MKQKRKRRLDLERLVLLVMVPILFVMSIMLYICRPKELDLRLFVEKGQFVVYDDENYESIQGIDVSSHQGNIDYQKVKEEGIGFVMVRVGYRQAVNGDLQEDTKAKENIQGAIAAGLDVGLYIYSQACTMQEVQEETDLILSFAKDYDITYPIVYDMELFEHEQARINALSNQQKTTFAKTFLEAVEKAGYQPMIYANTTWLNEHIDYEKLSKYPLWYANYDTHQRLRADFWMWQYSQTGTLSGINGNVDLNVRVIKK